MTLRTKTLSIVGIILSVLIGSIYILTASLLSDSFLKLEKTTIERNVNRITEAINDEVAGVEGFTGDYSDWDETVKFVLNPNQEYIESNLAGVTFENLKINDFVFVNKAGEIVWGMKYDLDTGEFLPISDDLKAQIKPGSPLLDRKDHDDTLSGLFLQQDHPPAILIARPLMNSEGEGDIFGTIIITRDLDEKRIEKISKQTHLTFSFERIGSSNMPKEFSDAYSQLSDAQPILVRPIDDQLAAGYTILKDLYGKQVLVLKVDVPREVFQQGVKTTRYFLVTLVVLGLIFMLIVLVLLGRLVLNRLAKLSHDVKGIGESSDFSARVQSKGSDELGALSSTINWMLSSLQSAQNELQSEKMNVEEKVNERTEELAAERNKMAMILSGMTDSVIAIDQAGRIITLNQNAQQLVGATNNLVGVPINEVVKVYESKTPLELDDYAPLRNNFEGVLYESKNLTVKGLGGKESTVRFSSSQIKEGPTVNLRAILTIHDITAEQQLEAMKLDFVTMAAHELRTPIAVIEGYLEIMSKQPDLDEKIRDYVQKSLANTHTLVGLINNLLSVSKIERNSLAFTPTELDLRAVIKSAVNDQKINAQQSQVKIEFNEPQKPLPVSGDELMLKEVVNNLLSNAIHYTPSGGQISITAEERDQKVTVLVKDTGTGIPAAALPKIFTKFYRVHGGLESGSKGTGLGLFITKSIVELHGGSVGVESTEGKGSTFHFTLPLLANFSGSTAPVQDQSSVIKKLNYGWLSKDTTN